MAISDDKLADLRLKSLEMVQTVIGRMAGYSATLKNYCITLTTAIAGFSISTKSPSLLFLGFLPILIFALLDAKYLLLERRFRCLFDMKRGESWEGTPSFDMSLEAIPHVSISRIFLSWSICLFYVPLAIALLVTIFVVER